MSFREEPPDDTADSYDDRAAIDIGGSNESPPPTIEDPDDDEDPQCWICLGRMPIERRELRLSESCVASMGLCAL